MNWQKWLLATTFTLSLSTQVCGQAFTPSSAQIAQFKNMSPAQQQAAARAAGIDINDLNLTANASSQPQIRETQNRKPHDDNDKQGESYSAQSETKEIELELFGHNLFDNDSESFLPATSVPIPADYILGPGDTLVIQLYGKDNSSHSLTVNREGQIQFPQIGPISFAGLSFLQAQELIRETVQEQMIGVKASVTMGSLRSIRVFVLGEVQHPGSFTVGSLSTMTNALFSSGGITKVGSLRKVQLKRQGKVITTLDLYDLLLKGDTSGDSRLLPGDVIFAPPIGQTVSIEGAVNRPAIYEIKHSASASSLIKLAGGLKNTSYLPVSQLTRFDAYGEKDLININLSSKTGKSFSLKDGDALFIPPKLDVVSNQVKLVGHIKREGYRSWKPGLHFSDLVPSPMALPLNPELDLALIERFNITSGTTIPLLFSPRKAWASTHSAEDPLLHDYDIIQLFNFSDSRPQQLESLIEKLSNQSKFGEIKKVVAISGSVRFPGQYPLATGMTSQDLIQLAGGLTESALDTNGEITRYGIDANRARTVSHIPVNFNVEPSKLRAGDTLQVKQIPLWKEKESITITGEVMFPGTYSILPGETLTQVLERAGGFTQHSYPVGAVLSREGLRSLEKERLDEMKSQLEREIAASNASDTASAQKAITPDEAALLLKNLDSIKPAGRMVIDLPSIMASPQKHDFKMENGDTLSIPRYKPSVTVVGEVQFPTSHFYQQSLDAMEYIDRSGGFKKHADNSRVYIVKANGRVIQPSSSAWFKADADLIQAGDTIVVPLETDKVDGLTIWAQVTQIAYQAALGAAAVNGL